MSISRKIKITEPQNLASYSGSLLPIRKLFDVGPITSSNNITNVSTFEMAQISNLNKRLLSSSYVDNGTFPVIKQTYEYTNFNADQTMSDWQQYVQSNLKTSLPADHYTVIDGLYDINDAYYMGISQPTHVANINYEYNFLIENYESAIAPNTINEKILPNMYAIMFAKLEEDVGSQKRKFDNFITLNKAINSTETYSLQNKNLTNKKPSGEYHDLYAKAIRKIRNNQRQVDFSNITGPMTNIVIPPEQLKNINEMSTYKELYPMYNEINITMDKFSSFSTLLKDSNLTLSLINFVINSQPAQRELLVSEQQIKYSFDVATDNLTQKSYNLLKTQSYATTSGSLSNKNINVYNIYDWWNKTKEDFTPSETNDLNTVVFGVNDETLKITEKDYDFARSLSYVIFYGKLRKLISQTQRDFNQIISADPAYSEAVFYKITKHINGISDPIQTFWIPNSADIDTFQFIDTQVKYNRNYEYRISAYNIIIANSIQTTTEKYRETTKEFSALLEYTMEPVVSLVEVPVYNITNKIIDDPPISPEILVIPSKNVNNKIKFYFNNSTGEEENFIYSINVNELQTLKQINTMYTTLPTKKVKFKSDDIASAFEVYRITKKPVSYTDFNQNLIATVSTDYNKATLTKASAASYIDNIQPNTKYYYTFRAIDYHGHISNPTDVYELEMVDDDGAIYLRTNIITLKDLKLNKQGEKTFKKLFYIKPEIMQTLINADMINQSGIDSAYDIYTLGNTNVLGMSAEAVWNKKFKLRFVSKKTGKMFDLNLQMELEIDKEKL